MRLDKWLSNSGFGSRKEVRGLLKEGRVKVNGTVIKDPGEQVSEDQDQVSLDGVPLKYEAMVYYMLNKPQGVITATEDPKHPTILDLIETPDRRQGLYPVGRLDKDTEGLLLITNDGPLGHRLLSPKHHVEKTYEAILDGDITQDMIGIFEKGIELTGDGLTKPAKLKVLIAGESPRVEVVITEGKFHQIKRMFHAVGREVLYLKRTKMGPIELDPDLALGSYRPLTIEELNSLKSH